MPPNLVPNEEQSTVASAGARRRLHRLSRLHTPVCDLLGIELPILQAGMSSYTTPELVAAVSNAGGLGIIGGLGRSADELREEIQKVRAVTARPFGGTDGVSAVARAASAGTRGLEAHVTVL